MANEKNRRKGRKGSQGGGSAAVQVELPDAAGGAETEATAPGSPAPTAPPPAQGKPAGATLASRIADAAAARLLLMEQLPEDERPRPDDRVLLLGLIWGGSTLIELEQIGRGGDLAVGRLFDLPAVKLPRDFRLVRHVGTELVFTVPAELKTEVHEGKQVRSFETLASTGKARAVEAPFRGYAYTVQSNDRIVMQVAPQLTLIARYTRAARARSTGVLDQVDLGFFSTLIVALLALALFWLMLGITPRTDDLLGDDLTRNQSHYTKYQVKPPEKELPRFKDLSGVKEGQKARGDEGKFGKEEAKKKDADPSKAGAPLVDPNKAEKDRKVIMKKGLLAALSKLGAGGGPGAVSSVLGPGGLGTGINNALGGVKGGGGMGDAYGVGGLGSRGGGSGGGGQALGIGSLGTRGSGHGRGGYGDIDLGGRGKDDTQFIPGKTTVVGGLSRDVINRIIQRHYNEIKYCYEKELTKDPGLYGKVTMLFVIDGGGKVNDALIQQTTLSSEPVESCILNHVRRWAFPQGQGGGTTQVTYPYVFKASGQ